MPTISRDNTTIAYEATGHGEPLVLGHSFLLNREMWRPQIDRLAGRYRVVAVDWRGHGESGPARGNVTLDDLADDVLAVLDAEGIERATWVGLSIGGMVAMREAIRDTGRVGALVLVDTDADTWRTRDRVQARLLGLFARVAGTRPAAPAIPRMFFAARTRRQQPDLVARWRKSVETLSVPSVLCLLETLARRPSMIDQVGAITVPTLIIHGANDASIPAARAEQLHRAIPGSQLRLLPDCGHIASLDQPDLVGAAIEEFLGSLAASEAPPSWPGGPL